MTMKQEFVPDPGKIAVVREAESDLIRRAAEAGIEAPDEVVEDQKRANPWAFVVGVGPARKTERGYVTTDVEEGDKVLISEVGRFVPLRTSDGETDWIYVLPFEGIMGRLRWRCGSCGWSSFKEPAGGLCPKCPRVKKPTPLDSVLIGMTKKNQK